MPKFPVMLIIAILFISILVSCSPGLFFQPTYSPNSTVPATKTSQVALAATLTPDNTVIQIPEWVKNSENNIILLSYLAKDEGRPLKAGLINPKTGEQTYITFQKPFYYYYWEDAQHVVFLHGKYCNE